TSARVSNPLASKWLDSLLLNQPTVRYRSPSSPSGATVTSASSRPMVPNSPRLPFSPVSRLRTFGEDPAPAALFVPVPVRRRLVMVLIRPSHSTRTLEGEVGGARRTRY